VAGVALARLTERLAHTLPVQLSCLVVVDHVLGSSLAAGSTGRHAAVFPASAPGRLKRQGSNCMIPLRAAGGVRVWLGREQEPERQAASAAFEPRSSERS
jgi:hypothetical protein